MHKISYILILLFFCVELSAQKLPFTRFSVYEGLSQSQVTCLALDEWNRVIIGTKSGLNIFDGIEMKTLEDSLLFIHTISSIYPYKNYLYICISQTMIVKYNIKTEKIEKYWNRPKTGSRLQLFDIVIDENEQVLIRTDNLPKMIYKLSENSQELIKYDSITNPQIENIGQWKFDKESGSIIILGSKGKLWTYKNKKISPLLLTDSCNVMYQQTPQTPIYFSANNGVYTLQKGIPIHLYDIPEIATPENPCFAVDADENSYYKTYNKEKKSFELKKYNKKQTISTGFFNTAIGSCLLIKDENHICVPTESGFYYNPSQAFTLYDESISGMLPNIWNIMEDKNGNIKFASWGNGLATLNPNTQKITADERYLSLSSSRSKHFYMGGIRAKNGDCYFSLNGLGVLKYDGIKYDTLSYKDMKERATAIMSMYEDIDKIYFGEKHKLFIYDKLLQKITACQNISLQGKTANGYVSAIAKDKMGNLWIGGSRCAVWDTKSDSIQKLYLKGKDYPIKGAMSLYKDYKENMWFGGFEGLAVYDYQTFTHVAAARIRNAVYSITNIDSSYLVLGCIEGLYFFDLQRFYKNNETWLYFFEKNNGYLIEESGQNGFYKEVSGKNIWLIGNTGVAKINVPELKRQMKNVYLETGILKVQKGEKSYDFIQPFSIYADENENLSVFLKNNRHQIVYEYCIEYEGGTKIQQTTRDTILSIPLRQGLCKITLKVKLATGFTQGDNFVINFEIKPYFWKTAWGILLIILLITGISIGIILLYYRYQTQKAQLQAEIQLAQERDDNNKKELAKKSAELVAMNAQLNTNLFKLEQHFVLNFLNSSVSYSIMKDHKHAALDSVAKFAAFLRKSVLDDKRAFWEIEKETDFVKDYVELENLRWGEKIAYSLEMQADIETNTLVPKGIIQNYVSNAIKHAFDFSKQKGHIFVRIHKDKASLILQIEDDGKGIEVNNLFLEKISQENASTSTHKGIALVQTIFEYLNQLNEQQSSQFFQNKATISPSEKGTLVTITLPYRLNIEYEK